MLIKNFPYQRKLESISEMSSDHNPVKVTIGYRSITPDTNIPRIDWKRFGRNINNEHYTCYNIHTHEEMEQFIVDFKQHILESAIEAQNSNNLKPPYVLPKHLLILKQQKNQAQSLSKK